MRQLTKDEIGLTERFSRVKKPFVYKKGSVMITAVLATEPMIFEGEKVPESKWRVPIMGVKRVNRTTIADLTEENKHQLLKDVEHLCFQLREDDKK